LAGTFRDEGDKKRYQAEWKAEKNAKHSEVGVLPQVKNPERKERGRHDLLFFLQTYFPESTGLSPFSEDHKNVIANIQNCLTKGGRFAQAVYRGFSKTTIAENSCIWATIYGHRKFVPLFGAEGTLSANSIESIRKELEGNILLEEDFPEVVIPIQKLEGKFQRCASQTHNSKRTYMRWTGDWIVLPTIEGSVASGGVIMARGILSAARGIKIKHPNGKNVRPDGVVIDDFQTDDSARSPSQVTSRLNLIRKAILKSAGHRKSIGCIVNGTVIEENDGMEQLLADPGWQSAKIPMVRKWADKHDMWLGEYAEIRRDFDKEVAGSQLEANARATEFYREHMEEMDAGCEVSWETCYDPDVELSAIQHAYNLLIDDGEEVFESECQQNPIRKGSDPDFLNAKDITEKQHASRRSQVPIQCDKLIAYIDVQKEMLFWEIWGFSKHFDGFLIDNGEFPDQKTLYYEKRKLRYKLSETPGYAGMSLEARLYKALNHQIEVLLNKKYNRQHDGIEMSISKIGMDGRYKTETVRRVFQDSQSKGRLQVCMGYGIGAKRTPMRRKKIKDQSGEMAGFGWFLGEAKAGVQVLEMDTNVIKTFFHQRLATEINDRGSFSLFKVDSVREHLMTADHYTSEFRTQLEGPYGIVDEWEIKPGNPDNDRFDCAVGCTALASFTGTKYLGADHVEESPKKRPGGIDWNKWGRK
jgi:hypothetical protein